MVALTYQELYRILLLRLLEKDLYIHIEVPDYKQILRRKNLRRFHSYDALFSHNMDADVITYVIYTGEIKQVKK